ncbi:PREDICTED: eukaryotic translation initiation factor 4E-1-like, partial [Nicotiana attenuata]|uniref:eukaryotic translation initiation factor 4E-1-like n=1 Tax=Nicotiana attenuata TaxID=49451 RepID=UPI000905D38C
MAGEAKTLEEAEKLKLSKGEVVDDGPEDGEIMGKSVDTASYLGKEIKAKHPLEHSWTFWFDNPLAKSRQAIWGSSLRDVSIGKQWKEFLDYSDWIGFIFHDDAKRLDRGAKSRYIVEFSCYKWGNARNRICT